MRSIILRSFILKSLVIAAALAMLGGTAAAATSFVVPDYDTGNPYFTADLSVDPVEAEFGRAGIEFLPEEKAGFDITGYSITQTDAGPGDWEELIPVDYQFPALPAEGEITLYAWVKYSDPDEIEDDIIEGPFSDSIVYSTNVVTSIDVDEVVTHALAYEIALQWETDLSAVGWLEYRVKDTGDYVKSEPSSYGEWHTIVLTDLTPETEYDITIYSNGASLAYPMTTLAADPVPGDLTWSGALGEDDLRWSRGLNWVGGAPPTNPTNATLTLANQGTGASELDANRTVRYLEFNNPDLDQTIDLSGNTLTIAGDNNGTALDGRMRFSHASGLAEAAVTNGKLQVGTPNAASDLRLSIGAGRQSTLAISSQLEQEPKRRKG